MDEVNIDTLTLEQYLVLSGGNQASSVVRHAIANNVNFEIKSQFIRELRKDTFLGNKNDDAHEHVERVLDIASLFNTPGVNHVAVMLHVFPITLTSAAKRWFNKIPSGTINTLDLLKNAFIQRISTCKDFPINEEVKGVEEVKYGEVGRTSPNNNGSRYRIGPPGYYTYFENRPPFKERRTSLEEIVNKY
ncbi:hypothetical protein Tco_0294412 [Tanacetum coccineum]